MIKLQQLARKSPCHNYANLIGFIKNIINSDTFQAEHKMEPSDFTRNRKLPFHQLIVFFMNLLTGAYQKELDGFFKALMSFEIPKRFVSKAALSKARMKLKYQAFIELNRHLIQYFYEKMNRVLWHGFQLIVVDGTLIRIPKIQAIMEHFSVWNPAKGDICPMARVMQLFDPLNRLSIAAEIGPERTGEREMAATLFTHLMPKDLVLLDRGFPAYWLFNLILTVGAQFCARIPNKKWKIIRKFYYSGKIDKIVSLPVFPTSIPHCTQMGLELKPLLVRLLRIELPNGDVEILITSLTDQELYPFDIFSDLYHLRWFVEEDYKKIKCWIEVENFTGKSVLSVQQDFYARILAKNLASVLSCKVDEYIKDTDISGKWRHQVNFAHVLTAFKDTVVLLFNRSIETVRQLSFDLFYIFINTTEPIRPNRQYPRIPKKRRNFYTCYRPIG